MPTSTPTSGKAAGRAGFSLMEILVVLVILALSTAVIMPSTSRMLDQATAHAVFFEFQRQVSDLRREANRTSLPIRLVDPVAASGRQDPAEADDARTLTLRSPWRYTLAPALDIDAGGVCSPTTANLINGDRVVMTLRSVGDDCRFIRLQSDLRRDRPTGAAPPLAPSSP
ncbi:MAG: type II secretion system GspH family protein [Brevundimonas sp.]|uniref:pilus assembly FimT family protein n=1 Tax=Brevundimonas sp. TaxID=1871086 RepID=UPI0025841567|nr:type II secretion system protein [Brevundimonas sp.]MCV0414357.1 type II secretion system GspH family protein [Brevundimonas sp.]